jgi:hypothetical protein
VGLAVAVLGLSVLGVAAGVVVAFGVDAAVGAATGLAVAVRGLSVLGVAGGVVVGVGVDAVVGAAAGLAVVVLGLPVLGVAAGVVVALGVDGVIGAAAWLADLVGICVAAAGPGRGRGACLLVWLVPAAPVAIAAAVRILARTPVACSPLTPTEAA